MRKPGDLYWALATVFPTMAAIGIPRWSDDDHLVVLGVLTFLAATMGREARRRLWPNWARLHMTGMGASYVLLLTAFYVDNGPDLPLWRLLPHIAVWLLPAAIGMPILIYALLRHPLVRRGGSRPVA
jgi:peptidoglycan/LPS O-acetylase OafA/YrhL